MFRQFFSGLIGAAPAAAATSSAQLALAALLVRVARSDDAYDQAEIDRIDRFLADHFAINPFAAVTLRAEAERLEAGAADTVRFTRALKEAVPDHERLAILEALWSVVLSDGERHADEDATLRLVASLLGVSDRDSALARQRVERSC